MKHSISILFFFLLAFYSCGESQSDRSEIAKKALADYEESVISAVESASFTTLDGSPVSIADFRGKVVILDFWETWCGPCIRSFPTLDQLANEYSDDFVVLAVSPGFSDSPDDVKEFVNGVDYNFQWVFNDELASKLRIEGIPYKVFLDANGHYIKTVMGSYPDDYDKITNLIADNKKR